MQLKTALSAPNARPSLFPSSRLRVPLGESVSSDPDDDALRACALAARAELIVTRDRDLLVLVTFRNIHIFPACSAPELLAASER